MPQAEHTPPLQLEGDGLRPNESRDKAAGMENQIPGQESSPAAGVPGALQGLVPAGGLTSRSVLPGRALSRASQPLLAVHDYLPTTRMLRKCSYCRQDSRDKRDLPMRGSSQRRRRMNRRYRPSLEHGSVGGVALEPRLLLNAASPARLNSGALAARFEQVRRAPCASGVSQPSVPACAPGPGNQHAVRSVHDRFHQGLE